MLQYSFSDYYWLYLITIPFWIIVSLISLLIKKWIPIGTAEHRFFLFLVAIAFSFLGITVGLLIGLSISPVIGVVIPALLTFFGGFIAYVFVLGKSDLKDSLIMIIIIISISFFLVVGMDYGTAIRVEYARKKAIYDEEHEIHLLQMKYTLSQGNIVNEYPTRETDTSTQMNNNN